MHVISFEQGPSLVSRLKHTESPKQEEDYQFDYRQYRYLLFVFADNINQSLRNHRDCLGEIQYHPKFRVSKDEQQGYEQSLAEIFQKYSSKLLKESVYRNTLIKKSYDLFLAQYEKVFPMNAETDLNKNKRNGPSIGFLRKMTLNQGKKSSLLSSRSQNRKTVSTGCAQDKLLHLSQTFKAFQADLSMTLKLKTISSDNPQTKQCFLRATRSTISRNERLRLKSDHFPLAKKKNSLPEYNQGDNSQQIIFKGNQILISQHRKSNDQQWECQKEIPFHSKFCTKRVVAICQPQKKTINDLEKFHMQNKNAQMNNSVFWSPTIDFTHKPKFKRWQHSFS